MNIQPLSQPVREISVTAIIEPAYERVKQVLFRPFDLGKWFTIGFCAWLAGLGESGGGFNWGGGGGRDHGGNGNAGAELRHFYFEARDYVLANLGWILPLAIGLLLVGLAFWLVLLWVNCRGKFMFVHCVALNRGELTWGKHAATANSLFWFRLVVGLLVLAVLLPMAVFLAMVIFQMVLRGEPNVAGVMTAVGLGLGFFAVVMGAALIQKLLVDFVVPIMYLRQGKCLAAWRELLGLMRGNFWRFVLYVLFQIVLGMAIGVLILLAVVLTCCVAGCLMLLPFLGTVLLLPVLTFTRAYPLYYLAQYGPQYDVFAREPETPPAPVAVADGL